MEVCMTLVPGEDDEPVFDGQAAAEDCACALPYAIGCRRGGGGQEAAWAARRTYEAVDHFVIHSEHARIDQPGAEQQAGAEQQVLAHTLLQAELARQ
jgi:hypothetical protein